ncbi:MAG: hypothetical protein ACTSVI_08975 [Promethearchaeota archaeon]
MSEEKKEEVKDSNELLNIFMIIIGAVYMFQGIVYYVESYFPGTFNFLPSIIKDTLLSTSGEGGQAFRALMGDNALQQFVMGTFCFVAGVGMFQEQEWAWGMAIVLLSIILITTTGSLINSFISWSPTNLTSWGWWIKFISVAFAGLGIFWLLGTKERYS